MKSVRLCAVLLFAVSSLAAAQGFDYSSIEIDISVKDGKIVQGSRGTLEFKFTIPFGNSLTVTEEFPEIKLMNEVPGLKLGKLEKPEPDYTDAVGGHWEFEAVCKIPFYFAHDTEPGEHEAVFGFVLQACEKSGMCYFPTDPKDIQERVKITLVGK